MYSNQESMNFRKAAKKLNDRTYTDYYHRLMLMARSVFEWSGLPNGIDEKWIERYLFFEGCCMFFHDEDLGYMVAKTAPRSHLNEYDEPTELRPVFTNHTGNALKSYRNNKDCVLIRNNDIMIPTAPTIELFAIRLTEIQRTIDININAQKTPVLLTGSDKQKVTMKNTFSQWDGFEPVIYGDKTLDTIDVKALRIDAPVVFDKLQIQKHAFYNECMTFLGINNANMDKRERLVAGEVQANNEQIGLSAAVMLKSREKACELINDLFGLSVSVKIRESIKPEIEEIRGGVAIGSPVHGTAQNAD